LKAFVAIQGQGDVAGARSFVQVVKDKHLRLADDALPTLPLDIDILARDYDTALNEISVIPAQAFDEQYHFRPPSLMRGEVLHLMGKSAQAKLSLDSAVTQLERSIREHPDDSRMYSSLGRAYASLGRPDEAFRNGKRGVELMPITTDAIRGAERTFDLAVIYSILGRNDDAIEQIKICLEHNAVMTVSPALLRLSPWWDGLRKDPRFQALSGK